MANKESTFTNMLLTMVIVTAVAALALGGVYKATKAPIAKNQEKKTNAALQKVLPEFDNKITRDTKTLETDLGKEITLYKAKKDGELVGVAIESFSTKGYSGLVKIMVGFLPDGTIKNISVLQHAETPGLGDKMEKGKSEWSKQFNGKNPAEFNLSVSKDGGDVDAITAATISSRAYCDAVKRAYKAFKQEIKGGE
ncbi:MAG: RnfABCDGE type electron transport complex subunit G [Bacteroidales bacterium]|nr:RnfABCDGE type electron transport complex subunit G [Bacteroidales bacterium]MCF8328162.1 RnfABCDGE type electron transport complex subunit G [Bacteroidales bacterium]